MALSPPNILNESDQICKFLAEVTAESRSTPFQQPRFKVFKECFSVVPLPTGTLSSLTEFTGPQKGVTVVISRHTEPAADEASDLDQSVLASSSLSDATIQESHEPASPQPTLFPLQSFKVVNVGQQLLQKRAFLSNFVPMHTGLTPNAIQSVHSADISSLVPLTLDEARYLASLYSIASKSSTSLPNIWILCTSDKQNIVCLGCSFTEAQSSLCTYTISSDGIIKHPPSDKVWVGTKGAVGVKRLSNMTGSVYSQYRITGASTTDDKDSGNLTVQFCWSDPERILCHPPESADAVVRVSATPGYMFSPVLATYNELNTLLSLCKITAGVLKWPSQEESSEVTVESVKTVSQRIESFLGEVATPLSQPIDATVISPTADNTIYETRKDLDFAERLWMFAKDAVSLDDLQQTFAAVFKALLLGKVQPFVHRSSASTLALLLRQLLCCASAEDHQALAPRFQSLLSQTKLVPCLVQIGLEKMRRDYRAFFVGSDIATDDQLNQFFSTTATQSQLIQCHTLCKIHNVLEINASVLSFLNLPTSTLSSLTKVALDVYKEIVFEEFCTTPVIALPLPAYSSSLKSVSSLCSKLSPTIWTFSPNKEQTVYVYRNEAMFMSSENCSDDEYYMYKAHYDCVSLL